VFIQAFEFNVRWKRPGRRIQIIRADLKIHTTVIFVITDWEIVYTTRTDTGGSLAAKHWDVRIVLMKPSVLIRFVIKTQDVHRLLKSIVAGLGVIITAGDRARTIFLADDGSHMASQLPSFRLPLVRNLVADAPHHHTGMIAIASDQSAQIRFMPISKEQMIILIFFARLPAVKRLVHNQHTHTITELQ